MEKKETSIDLDKNLLLVNKESFDQTELNSIFVKIMLEQKRNPSKYNFSDPDWHKQVRYKVKFYDNNHHTYISNFLENLEIQNKFISLCKTPNKKTNEGSG